MKNEGLPKPNIEKLNSNVQQEFEKIVDEFHLDPDEIQAAPEGSNVSITVHDQFYNVSSLLEFYQALDEMILNSGNDLKDTIKIIANKLVELFKPKYVEFLMLKDKYLEYTYITFPAWLVKFINKISGLSPIIGMKIPLFQNSLFTQFMMKAKPSEIMTYEQRLQSMQDFLEPSNAENIFKRNYIAPILIKFINYDYIFQVPLIVNKKIFGYFSFIQKGRYSERVKADIIMLSGKISNLIALKKMDEERRNFCKKIKQAVVILDVVPKKNFSGYDFIVSEVNQELLGLFGIGHESIIKVPITKLLPKNYHFLLDIFQLVYVTGKPEIIDIQFINDQKVLRSAISRTENDNLLIIGKDVTEKTKLALYDKLTEVFNRHTFVERCRSEMMNTDKDDSMFALFFLDLDQFKQVNDAYGHETGDKYLCMVANALKISLRKNDLIGRYGGDEFTIFSSVNDLADAEKIANKIREITGSIRINVPDGQIIGSASIGISCHTTGESEDITGLIRKSDEAMYRAKKQNTGYCFYNSISGNSKTNNNYTVNV
jgi:diguanylate cyclase (GGDEF)-like protein